MLTTVDVVTVVKRNKPNDPVTEAAVQNNGMLILILILICVLCLQPQKLNLTPRADQGRGLDSLTTNRPSWPNLEPRGAARPKRNFSRTLTSGRTGTRSRSTSCGLPQTRLLRSFQQVGVQIAAGTSGEFGGGIQVRFEEGFR
jgi:hypothetical protein